MADELPQLMELNIASYAHLTIPLNDTQLLDIRMRLCGLTRIDLPIRLERLVEMLRIPGPPLSWTQLPLKSHVTERFSEECTVLLPVVLPHIAQFRIEPTPEYTLRSLHFLSLRPALTQLSLQGQPYPRASSYYVSFSFPHSFDSILLVAVARTK